MGIAIGVAALGHRLFRPRPAAIAGLALAMGFAAYFASVSTDRLPRFRNDARLFAEAIERYPVNPFATICLAYEYSGNGYYLEAVSMFQRTLEVSKWQSLRNDANQIIALNYDHLDAPALAYPHYREVLQERPEDEMLPGRTKNAFDAMQAHAKEIETLEAQLRENDSAPIEDLERLAQLYALNGRTNESIELYERAAELGLAGNEVSEGIIDALTLGGRPHEALALARDAYAQTPEHAEVAYLYIRALLRAREIAEARSALAMSAERFPEHAGMSRLHRLLADGHRFTPGAAVAIVHGR